MPTSMPDGSRVYLDTSGVLAYLDAGDEFHAKARAAWEFVIQCPASFLMTDWVRLECWSLLQRRLGLDAAEDFKSVILPLCHIDVVDAARFELLTANVLLMRRRDLRLVDLSSFDCMRRHGVKRALAFDRHFTEQGFVTPESGKWRVRSA